MEQLNTISIAHSIIYYSDKAPTKKKKKIFSISPTELKTGKRVLKLSYKGLTAL